MSRSRSVNVDRVLEQEISEERYVELSASFILKIREGTRDWRRMVKEEYSPEKVRRKSRDLATVANTLEEVQRRYRKPHAAKHDARKRENFDDETSELFMLSNKAISYVNDLGTQDLYELEDTEDIGLGEFCVWQDADESYVTPREVLEEMPDNHTQDMVRVQTPTDLDDLPEFDEYTALHEI